MNTGFLHRTQLALDFLRSHVPVPEPEGGEIGDGSAKLSCIDSLVGVFRTEKDQWNAL